MSRKPSKKLAIDHVSKLLLLIITVIHGLNAILYYYMIYIVESIKLKHVLLYTTFRSKQMFPDINAKCLMKCCNYNYYCLNHIM